jgi:hypothetical protein
MVQPFPFDKDAGSYPDKFFNSIRFKVEHQETADQLPGHIEAVAGSKYLSAELCFPSPTILGFSDYASLGQRQEDSDVFGADAVDLVHEQQ